MFQVTACKHADYLADRAAMMQARANLLDAWKQRADVVPLRHKHERLAVLPLPLVADALSRWL